jgi:hypothetical protein
MTTHDFIEADRKLHAEWFASYGDADIDFIHDGATESERWLSSPWRIMCLLKEAHGGGQWNHADAILKDDGLLRVGGTANQAIHYRMVEWIYAVEATLTGAPFSIESDRSDNYRGARATMLRSAWVNIKKANGIAYSNNSDLNAVVRRDGDYLRRQVSLLAPKIVLCGYTFGLVRESLFPDAAKISDTEFSYCTANGVIIIDYYHPGRKSRESYVPLVEEVSRIMAAWPLTPVINK